MDGESAVAGQLGKSYPVQSLGLQQDDHKALRQ